MTAETLPRRVRKLYLFRLFRAFYRLSRAFWQLRRTNFIGVALIAGTLCALLLGEAYSDLKLLLGSRQVAEVQPAADVYNPAGITEEVPWLALRFLWRVGFDANGQLNTRNPMAAGFLQPAPGSAPLFRSGMLPSGGLPEWVRQQAGAASTAASEPVAANVAAAAQEQPATPAPPPGIGRYYWVSSPKAEPRKEFQYGPPPAKTPQAEPTSTGETRSRRLGASPNLVAGAN
jgi:hypothetical protein